MKARRRPKWIICVWLVSLGPGCAYDFDAWKGTDSGSDLVGGAPTSVDESSGGRRADVPSSGGGMTSEPVAGGAPGVEGSGSNSSGTGGDADSSTTSGGAPGGSGGEMSSGGDLNTGDGGMGSGGQQSAPCDGAYSSEVCWYLAGPNSNCDSFCAQHFGLDAQASSVVGSTAQGGTREACAAVLSALGQDLVVGQDTRQDGQGLGCYIYDSTTAWWVDNVDEDPQNARDKVARVCGCNG